MATKEEVIDYVMTTPGNPNKAVLEGMLEDTSGTNVPTPTVEDAGKVLGVGDNGKYVLEEKGFTCTEDVVMLTEESVTVTESEGIVQGKLSYSELINAETISVTFNGVKYTCLRRPIENMGFEYGASYDAETDTFDWSQYPFNIASLNRQGVLDTFLSTETAGTYSIKIEIISESVETTECFEKAVRKVADPGFTCTTTEGITLLAEESVTTQVKPNPITGQTPPYAMGNVVYSQIIDADTIQVTFEGEKYTCQKRSVPSPGESYEYGASIDAKTGLPDFSQFPFTIISSSFSGNTQNGLRTETAGTYQIKIEAFEEITTAETTECFAKAVAKLVALKIKAESITTNNGNKVAIFDKTWNDIRDAIKNGVPCYVVSDINYLCTADDVNTLNVASQMFPVIQLSYPPTDTFAGKVYFLYTGIEGSSTEGTAQIARLTADSATDKLRFETNCSTEMN